MTDTEQRAREIRRMREMAADWRRPALKQIEGPNDLKIYGGTIADDIDRWADMLTFSQHPATGGEFQSALDRSPAQFFFEVGYGACWAEAFVKSAGSPPFTLTDAIVERAWDIAGEAHDDPEEFDRYLAIANALPVDGVPADWSPEVFAARVPFDDEQGPLTPIPDGEGEAWLVEFAPTGDRYERGKRVGPARGTHYYATVSIGAGRLKTRTEDPNEAMRFSRKQDAEAMILLLNNSGFGDVGAVATEHKWIAALPSEKGEGK